MAKVKVIGGSWAGSILEVNRTDGAHAEAGGYWWPACLLEKVPDDTPLIKTIDKKWAPPPTPVDTYPAVRIQPCGCRTNTVAPAHWQVGDRVEVKILSSFGTGIISAIDDEPHDGEPYHIEWDDPNSAARGDEKLTWCGHNIFSAPAYKKNSAGKRME